MDPYSLKRDNRKKFQDKQRLKHRHATPSDRKYRVLNSKEKEGERTETNEGEVEEIDQEPPSNEARYHEDISMTFGDSADEERNSIASLRLKAILKEKEEREKEQDNRSSAKIPSAITTKSLQVMDLDDLNNLLGHKSKSVSSHRKVQSSPKTANNPPINQNVPDQKTAAISNVPQDLAAAQDFLDDLI